VISSLAALSAVAMAALSPIEADSMEAFVLGEPTGARALIGLYAAASISFAMSFAVAAVLTMVWTGLVRANLLVLAPNARHQRAAAWAWLSWMVPVVQIWFPFQVIRDIRLGVDPEASSGRPRRVALIQLVVWWLSLVAMVLVTRITFLMWSGGSPTFSAAGQMRLFDPVVGALALTSGVCWVLIIRAIERNQKQRRAEVSALASPGGLPS
jgi:hypothetical protein